VARGVAWSPVVMTRVLIVLVMEIALKSEEFVSVGSFLTNGGAAGSAEGDASVLTRVKVNAGGKTRGKEVSTGFGAAAALPLSCERNTRRMGISTQSVSRNVAG
jgi:hypothetical protein